MSRIIVASEGFYILAAIPEVAEAYSFYLYHGLYENGADIERRLKLDHQVILFQVEEPGEYRIKGFVEKVRGEKESFWSEPVRVGEASDDRDVQGARDHKNSDLRTIRLTSDNFELLKCPADIVLSVQALTTLRSSGLNVKELFSDIAALPMPKATGWFNLDKTKGSAKEVIEEGWTFEGFSPIKLDKNTDWGEPARKNRTWAYEVHAWRFFDSVLHDYLDQPDEQILDWMIEMALSWWAYGAEAHDPRSMVWYDMASSLRMARLTRLLVVTVKAQRMPASIRLLDALLEHVKFSFSNEFFNPNNNHGFYSAAAMIDVAHTLPMLPQSDSLGEIGEERMRTMVNRQFSEDGGHLEHSSDYHRMLLGSFEIALRDGIITDPEVAERIKRAAEVLGWMVQPNGKIVQFGDSPETQMTGSKRRSVNEHTQFIFSEGKSGTPNDKEIFTLPHSGYAFVRSPLASNGQQLKESSYLAFLACFHSRAHKHADDLTFTWFDRGQEIVVDSGRYGYVDLLPADSPGRSKGFYYGAPERQYVESSMAHNTVSLEGEDIERRNRSPYGSALGACVETDGHFTLSGEVSHAEYTHSRVLKFEPAQRLEVIDTITPKKDQVEVVSWFNLDGSLALSTDEQTITVKFPGNPEVLKIYPSGCEVELVPPVKGNMEPLRGWRSRRDRELEPIWNFGFKWIAGSRQRLTVTLEFQDVRLTGSATGPQ